MEKINCGKIRGNRSRDTGFQAKKLKNQKEV